MEDVYVWDENHWDSGLACTIIARDEHYLWRWEIYAIDESNRLA
jgi:hypothetical protein